MSEGILRIFPTKTSLTPLDNLSFYGENVWPGLFIPEVEEAHISCSFTWDIPKAEMIYKSWKPIYGNRIKIGGPAFDDPGLEFKQGMYLKDNVVITSRGCTKSCPWCFVAKREGDLRLLTVLNGNIIQDNNILACPENHQRKVFEMLETQKNISFSGGLDAKLLKSWHVDMFSKLSMKSLWFACDTKKTEHLMYANEIMGDVFARYSDNGRRKKRCYVLVGFNKEKTEEANKRLKKVWDLGFMPFAQFYRGKGEQNYNREWRKLVRLWSRPAAMYANLNEVI